MAYVRLFIATCFMFACLSGVTAQTWWPRVTPEMKPWARWWWMGSAVDEHNLNQLMEEYAGKGFGGLEIAPIYGAKGYDERFIDYLSPKWMEKLRYVVEKADSLGMKVDLTNGTGWPFGGPQVDKDHAASMLLVNRMTFEGKTSFKGKITNPDLEKKGAQFIELIACDEKGNVQLASHKVDGNNVLTWEQRSGKWELIALFLGKTGQKVKRAAPGGEGYTLDHFSSPALDTYLGRFDNAFGKDALGIRAFYNDSYEVYGADWTDQFFAAFKQRRGYDLRMHMPKFLSDELNDEVARIKSDYRETMSELLLEQFTSHWTSWAHRRNALTRNQAHGSPANLLDLYAAVDVPETEIFGSSAFPIPGLRRDSSDIRNVDPDPIMLRFASSAAHITGKPLASCETFTWLTEHFKTSWAQCKAEVDQVWLSGINHVFYHGTTYSPADVPWPGWLFYASVNFVPNNSLWPHIGGLNQYVTKVQSILQQGEEQGDVLVYWPVYDLWHEAKGRDMPFKVHNVDEWLHPTPFYSTVQLLQGKGYLTDFFSDDMLAHFSTKDGAIYYDDRKLPHRAIVIPKTKLMSLKTMEKLNTLARQGAYILFEGLPDDVPGYHQHKERKKKFASLIESMRSDTTDYLLDALGKRSLFAESLVQSGLKYVRRQVGEEVYYFLVNHSSREVDEFISLRAKGFCYILDPLSGTVGKAQSDGQEKTRIQVAPGESLILLVSVMSKPAAEKWNYRSSNKKVITLKGKWNLHFVNGGPHIPLPLEMETPQPWTSFAGADYQYFSGSATYTHYFSLSELDASAFFLELENVFESAAIKINGKDAGLIWCLPYRLKLDANLLIKGENKIEITVNNLMANRMRYLDLQDIAWNNYYDSPLVNIDYKPFSAKDWSVMKAGLEGLVTIAYFY